MSLELLLSRLERFPTVGLCDLPTPLRPLKNLSQHLGGPMIWEKREDVTGQGMGGNKLRKLDRVLHRAVQDGADTLVSGGVVQSNSQRQVAAAAAILGLDCHLAVYHGRVTPPTAQYNTSGNALLNHLYGATLHPKTWTGDRNGPVQALAQELLAEGKRPFVVPYGVSDALGAVGYSSAIAEIAAQSAQNGFTPTSVVHCTGSGATQAGLAMGAQSALPDCKIVGIDIDAEPERVKGDVIEYAIGGAALLGIPFDASQIEVIAGHAGPAYGIPNDATIHALQIAGRFEALTLDPVYSAKGMAGLIALIRTGHWKNDDNVIFLNTGGTPSLFAYADALSILPFSRS
ncbi:L-cysteate sulfo-lyase [Pseudovibrio axinellae]|uniref:L-cysteate sulfo-lyase n=1 Tax=Pseudovibrio axinellae TaxID=989403 RepID=A0A165WL30_9HYPH|nr:D-cysteine desulfhydrase family protein [Pseudovibrio axinellae]KZL16652.1 L-cysteate sulfo-lyase [Pseudovibrio axinellae]SER74489.1 D-cysteine desulfhydrase [Pseudovibrio axinellae]